MPPNKVVERLGNTELVHKNWNVYQESMNNDYVVALSILGEWLKKRNVANIRLKNIRLLVESRSCDGMNFTFNLNTISLGTSLKENGLTGDLQDGKYSVYEALKILIDRALGRATQLQFDVVRTHLQISRLPLRYSVLSESFRTSNST